MNNVDIYVDNGEDGTWGEWTELGVLEPGEQLGITVKSENMQIACGWHGTEAACDVPANGLVGPFETLMRMSARVKEASFRIQGNVIQS